MDTPLYSALRDYNEKHSARLHMPGHKGRLTGPLALAAAWDITEIAGADSLYEADGAIADTEDAYTALYGTAGSFLSAGGSTLCIQAMLALVAKPGSKLLCGRNIHTAAVNAMVLLDLEPVWLYPDEGDCGLMGAVSPAAAEQALKKNPGAAAVYITSPTYYGVLSDIKAIAEVCHAYGVPLLVDNAHGAYLKFLSKPLHPMELGADLCADSLHKTLPVLTGGALLHVGNPAYLADAKRKMALFGSTSPSYLILLSCDMALPYLRDGVRTDLERMRGELARLHALAARKGYMLPGSEEAVLHFTVDFGAIGYASLEYGRLIRSLGVEPEYLGERHCVFLASPTSSAEELSALERVLREIPPRQPLPFEALLLPRPERAMPPRVAAFAYTEAVAAEAATGRVASSLIAPCPPGIPLAVPGEKIDEDIAMLLKSYGISRVNVVK